MGCRVHTLECACGCPRMGLLYAMRGLSAVVRLDSKGIAKASKVGWAAGESHAFLFDNLE